jgi:O-antigen/teichoic acid export membrane protein
MPQRRRAIPVTNGRPLSEFLGWEDDVSALDFFAWIVLIVLLCSTVFVVIFLAMLPGIIAKGRNHPWAQAVTVAGWLTLFLGFALWPLTVVWAYVDIPSPRKGDSTP